MHDRDIAEKLNQFKNSKVIKWFYSLLLISSFSFLPACNQIKTSGKSDQPHSVQEKISFDIKAISDQGLVGSSDGLRSISYEFCIPAQKKFLAEVQSIEPNLKYFANSPGRIGCRKNQYLCLVDTHNSQWKEILFSIAQLEYVERIDQFYGE